MPVSVKQMRDFSISKKYLQIIQIKRNNNNKRFYGCMIRGIDVTNPAKNIILQRKPKYKQAL